MKLRTEILKFAEEMEKKMRANDPEKGQSWKQMKPEELQQLLDEEIQELYQASCGEEEYVDVANFCMMLHWHNQKKRAE